MDSKTYLDASHRTLSDRYDADRVRGQAASEIIAETMRVGDQLNSLRAALFYGKDNALRQSDGTSQRFDDCFDVVNPPLLHAALGIISEGVELLEAVLSDNLDDVNLLEEMGDIEWFGAIVYRYLCKLPEDARARNIAKLSARYPDKFSTEAYSNRDLETERRALENK